MPDQTSEEQVLQQAARQAGCIARAQALQAGMTDSMIRHRLKRGRWRRPHPGVYTVVGAPEAWEQDVWAAVLAAGPDVAVSHQTALLLHGVPENLLPRYPIRLTAPRGDHHRIQGVAVHQMGDLSTRHVGVVHGLTVARPHRAMVDIAAQVNVRRLGALLDLLITERMTTLVAVATCLAEIARPGKHGVRTLGAVLEERGDGYVPPASVLEQRLMEVLTGAGLPEPQRQCELPGRGAISGLVDAVYRDARLVIEADGRRWHSRTEHMRRDRQRDAEAARAGWMTLRFLNEQIVYEPHEVAATVADVRRTRLAQLAGVRE